MFAWVLAYLYIVLNTEMYKLHTKKLHTKNDANM